MKEEVKEEKGEGTLPSVDSEGISDNDNAVEQTPVEEVTGKVEEPVVVENVEDFLEDVSGESVGAEEVKPERPTIKLGMKEVTEIVDFGIAMGIGIEKSLADDKFTLEDIPNFMPSFMALIPAMTGWNEANIELLAASKEDVEKLKAHIRETVEMTDVQLEGLIQGSLALVLDIWHLVNTYFIKKH